VAVLEHERLEDRVGQDAGDAHPDLRRTAAVESIGFDGDLGEVARDELLSANLALRKLLSSVRYASGLSSLSASAITRSTSVVPTCGRAPSGSLPTM